jgi:predicted metal-dependent phosphoesterase TrpH
VHLLGYFFDPKSPRLAAFLEDQRADRVRRVEQMAVRLAALGKPIDVAPLVRPSGTRPGRSVGRPLVAWALVRAGHVRDVQQAFHELIAEGRPAFVPRRGSAPADVIAILGEAGGIASLAHPGLLDDDSLIPDLARRGLTALEAYHSDQDEETTAHYLAMAAELGLAVSGGSDYHGDAGHRRDGLGRIGLPAERFRELQARAGR